MSAGYETLEHRHGYSQIIINEACDHLVHRLTSQFIWVTQHPKPGFSHVNFSGSLALVHSECLINA